MTVYLAHGAILALVWFLLLNAIVSLGVLLTARLLPARDRSCGFWFALRVMPATAAAAFVSFVFLPSYWRYEPANTAEGFDLSLTLLAVASLALVVLGVGKGASAWLSAARRQRIWMTNAKPIGILCGVAAFEIDTDAPMMALAGIVRPRLIVTAPIAAAFSKDEMEATIAHEIAHWRARDNLKRLVMRLSPDVLSVTAASRSIERQWVSAAEHSADYHAVGVNPLRRCALASALLKLAKMMPCTTPDLEPISALIGGADITSRVARLLNDRPPAGASVARWRLPVLCGTALTIAALYPVLLIGVHEVTELLVRTLP